MSNPIARWVIEGQLRLATAARIGVGSSDAADITIGLDETTGRPLIPGTTLAGLLRHYIVSSDRGHYTPEEAGDPAERLFGIVRSATGDAGQSPTITFDAIADPIDESGSAPVLEIRDGVAINQKTGTAADHKKFDFEVIPAGATFPLRLDLIVRSNQDEHELVSWLARALQGLEDGEIRVGAKTSRGLGQVTATGWRAHRYDLDSRQGWLDWLASDHDNPTGSTSRKDQISTALSAAAGTTIEAAGTAPLAAAVIDLHLEFIEPLLIGSPGSAPDDPDEVQLVSAGKPVLTGTSVAGALRHRAWTIAQFIHRDDQYATNLVDWLFGPELAAAAHPSGDPPGQRPKQPPQQSRVHISEAALVGGHSERRTRIALDRFTGGVLDGLLFEQQPIVGSNANVTIEIKAAPGEEHVGQAIGLLVLVCRDVLDGLVSFGGNEAIGHGFAAGQGAISVPRRTSSPSAEPPFDLFSSEADALLESLWALPEVTR